MVKDKYGEHINSCWGYEYAKDAIVDAKGAVDYRIKEIEKEREQDEFAERCEQYCES